MKSKKAFSPLSTGLTVTCTLCVALVSSLVYAQTDGQSQPTEQLTISTQNTAQPTASDQSIDNSQANSGTTTRTGTTTSDTTIVAPQVTTTTSTQNQSTPITQSQIKKESKKYPLFVEANLPAGVYGQAISVKLTASNPDAQIWYTCKKNESPGELLKYEKPLVLGSSCALLFFAFTDYQNESKIERRNYTIIYSRDIKLQTEKNILSLKNTGNTTVDIGDWGVIAGTGSITIPPGTTLTPSAIYTIGKVDPKSYELKSPEGFLKDSLQVLPTRLSEQIANVSQKQIAKKTNQQQQQSQGNITTEEKQGSNTNNQSNSSTTTQTGENTESENKQQTLGIDKETASTVVASSGTVINTVLQGPSNSGGLPGLGSSVTQKIETPIITEPQKNQSAETEITHAKASLLESNYSDSFWFIIGFFITGFIGILIAKKKGVL